MIIFYWLTIFLLLTYSAKHVYSLHELVIQVFTYHSVIITQLFSLIRCLRPKEVKAIRSLLLKFGKRETVDIVTIRTHLPELEVIQETH